MVHIPTVPPPGGHTPPPGSPEKPNKPYSSKTPAKEPAWETKWKEKGYTEKQIKQFENNVLQMVNAQIQKDKEKSIKALRKMRPDQEGED